MRLLGSNRGFTLFEMMTVLGIVGVMFAVAAPSISTMREEVNLVSVQREIMSILYVARSTAIATNASRLVVITPPRQIQIKNQAGTITYSTQDLHAYQGISLAGPNPGAVTITYDARGLLQPTSPVTLTVSNRNLQTKTLTIYPTGRAVAG